MKIVYHPIFETPYPTAIVECPERVRVIKEELQGIFPFVEPEIAKEEEVLLVHSQRLLEEVKGYRSFFEVALWAVGGAICASRWALEGEKAFALVRPPGHHARRDYFWGFCFFNNVAISIERLLREGEIKTATVLDIDLHYGDGTADIFSSRSEVKVINIQENNRLAFLDRVKEALQEDESDLLAISAGFDRYVLDWGRTLEMEDFRLLGKLIAEKKKKVYACLEGGYYLPHLGKIVRAFLEGLAQ